MGCPSADAAYPSDVIVRDMFSMATDVLMDPVYFLLTTGTQEGFSISRHALTGKTINANGLFSLDWRAIYSPFRLQELAQNGFSPLHKTSAVLVGDLWMSRPCEIW